MNKPALFLLCFAPLVAARVSAASQPAASPVFAHSTQMIVVVTPGWDAVQGRLERYERSDPHESWRSVELEGPKDNTSSSRVMTEAPCQNRWRKIRLRISSSNDVLAWTFRYQNQAWLEPSAANRTENLALGVTSVPPHRHLPQVTKKSICARAKSPTFGETFVARPFCLVQFESQDMDRCSGLRSPASASMAGFHAVHESRKSVRFRGDDGSGRKNRQPRKAANS
jgi:hypothetical protein